ncbi:MAG: hypothetical protein AB1757_14705 [Acidobacteriota bacterium]
MNKRMAAGWFVALCLVLAGLLLGQIITPIIGGIIFAFALVLLGVASRGFSKTNDS